MTSSSVVILIVVFDRRCLGQWFVESFRDLFNIGRHFTLLPCRPTHCSNSDSFLQPHMYLIYQYVYISVGTESLVVFFCWTGSATYSHVVIAVSTMFVYIQSRARKFSAHNLSFTQRLQQPVLPVLGAKRTMSM
jgi:hypothetical protein